MRDALSRYENLTHLASLLRQAAETMRLFPDVEQSAGIGSLIDISLRIEEGAFALEDLATREVEAASKRQ